MRNGLEKMGEVLLYTVAWHALLYHENGKEFYVTAICFS